LPRHRPASGARVVNPRLGPVHVAGIDAGAAPFENI